MEITAFFISPEHTIADAIRCINENQRGIALVVDDDRKLIGTVVDGDIRRAIMDNLGLDTPITEILKEKDPAYAEPVTAPAQMPADQLVQLMKARDVRHVPLLDENDRVVRLFSMDDVRDTQEIPVQAVVMAGGFGTRLRPLTEDIPKPMLPIGDKPLLERLVGQLRSAGIRRVNVTTHYLRGQIETHFGDGSAFGIEMHYVNEEKPLGTAGGVGLMDAPNTPLLVMNGDLLTDVNFVEMYNYHRQQQALLTVAVRRYEFTVPYGVVESEDSLVTGLVEKPSLGFFVNAGIYLLEPGAFAMIPENEHFHMTDLITKLIEQGARVASFPIHEYWLDIGQHADYQKAQDDLKSGRIGR